MLKQFAPNARIPPSPNNSACTSSAIVTEIHAAYGPQSAAISVPPTAWPVVPPGSGILNIIPRNENAAPIPRSGICYFGISAFTFFTETAHTGTIAVPRTAQVDGLR